MKRHIVKSETFDKYRLELDSEGLLWIIHRSDIVFELEDAIKQEREINHFCEGKPHPFVIDVRVQNWDAPKEVSEFHSTNETLLRLKKCEALLVNNLGIRLLAIFYTKLNKPPVPTKVFSNEAEAIRWASKFSINTPPLVVNPNSNNPAQFRK